MTPHQALALAVRLFAIWYALVIARELLAFLLSWHTRNDPQMIALAVGGTVISAFILLGLWFFPRSIARGLLPIASEVPAQPSSQEMWFTLGTMLIGVWVVASAVPPILRNLTVMYLFQSELARMSDLRGSLVYYVIELLVGLSLIFGAARIRRFIWWVRHAGPG